MKQRRQYIKRPGMSLHIGPVTVVFTKAECGEDRKICDFQKNLKTTPTKKNPKCTNDSCHAITEVMYRIWKYAKQLRFWNKLYKWWERIKKLFSFHVGGEIQYNCIHSSGWSEIEWMHTNFTFHLETSLVKWWSVFIILYFNRKVFEAFENFRFEKMLVEWLKSIY